MFLRNKKILLALAAFALLAAVLPLAVRGQSSNTPGFLDCAKSLPQCGMIYAAHWASRAMYFFIALGAALIHYMLVLTPKILDMPVVKVGFSVSLAIANLGFILGIIVVAVMTILRSQTYGVKQMLWKLMLMAVAVNFGLVVAGAVLHFTDSLSMYFMSQVSPAADNWSESSKEFANRLTGAFDPQRVMNGGPKTLAQAMDELDWGSWLVVMYMRLDQMSRTGTDPLGADPIKVFVNMIFTVVFLFIVAFSIFAIGIMLGIRLVYLSYLLVILPLAWITWAAPGLQGNFSKWWHNFIRWAFFGPVSLFFLYLVLFTALNRDEFLKNNIPLQPDSPAAGAFYIVPDPGLIATSLEQYLLVFLALGGLVMANALSIKGAGAMMTGIKGVGKFATGALGGSARYAGRKGLQGASLALRAKTGAEGSKSLLEKAQERASRMGRFGQWATGLALRPAAKLAAAGGERQYEQESANIRKSGMTVQEAKAQVLSSFGPRRAALLSFLKDKDAIADIGAETAIGKGTKSLFARLGVGYKHEEIEKGFGISTELYEARKANMQSTEDGRRQMREMAEKWASKLERGDVAKMKLKDIYSGQEKLGIDGESLRDLADYLTYGLAVKKPAFASVIFPKVEGDSLPNFSTSYRRSLQEAERVGALSADRAAERTRQFNTMLANFSLGFTPVEAATAPAAAPPPPPPVAAAP